MDLLIQLVVTGFVNGCLYALIAIGLVLIYKTSNVFSFAHGQLISLGSIFIYLFSMSLNVPILVSILLGSGASFILGLLLEKLILRRFVREAYLIPIIVTISIGMVLDGIVYLTPFGSRAFSFPEFFPPEPIVLGAAKISWIQLTYVVVTLVLICAVQLFFKYSIYGVCMRAVSENRIGAISVGVPLGRIYGLAWGLACALATVAGFAIMYMYGVNYSRVVAMGILAVPVLILGGVDSIPGAVVGGVIMGIFQQIATAYIDPIVDRKTVNYAVPFFIALVVLLVRPYGLFGKKEIERM